MSQRTGDEEVSGVQRQASLPKRAACTPRACLGNGAFRAAGTRENAQGAGAGPERCLGTSQLVY